MSDHAALLENAPAQGSPPVQAVRDHEEVQRTAGDLREPSDQAIHAAGAQGVPTPPTPLQYLHRIQNGVGRHPVAHVRAHLGDDPARAMGAMNALAYAKGSHPGFGARPGSQTAAPEAAPVIHVASGGTLPVQRMVQPDSEEKVVAAKRMVQSMGFGESYNFVKDQDGKMCGGTGNCHGYSLYRDPNRVDHLVNPEDFLAHYVDQVITVFTKGDEVWHSARRHGDECVHKIFESAKWGPLVEAKASLMTEGYKQFQLPQELDTFKHWAKLHDEVHDEDEYHEKVLSAYGYYLDDFPDVAEWYRDMLGEDASNELTEKIFNAVNKINELSNKPVFDTVDHFVAAAYENVPSSNNE